MNNSESFLLLLKNLLNCTYEVLLPSQRYAKRLHGRDIYFAISEQCYHLTSTDAETVEVSTVDALATSQEEADTRIILHCMHICETVPSATHIIV